MKKQNQVVKVALQESIQLKLIQRLLIHVKIVQQENIHLLKVFQVVLVVMIVHPVNIQQQIQVIMMKVNVLTVQQIRTVQSKEETNRVIRVKKVKHLNLVKQVQLFVQPVMQDNIQTCLQHQKYVKIALLERLVHMVRLPAQIVQQVTTQMQPSKQRVVFHVVQASTAMKWVKALKLRVNIVQQENIHLQKVLQAVLVAMIVHRANTQKKQEI